MRILLVRVVVYDIREFKEVKYMKMDKDFLRKRIDVAAGRALAS